jgi:ubiquinone/menaquinone biosynthesis C-methylase UbiE
MSGLPANCEVIHGDFMNLPFENNSFDHVYAIESVCHAPDKVYYCIFSIFKKKEYFFFTMI